MKIFCFLIFTSILIPLFGKDDVFQGKLENGLRILVVRNPKGPVVYHSLVYNVGCADSPQGSSGIGHFVEHLMFKGTTKFPGNTFKMNINRIGGTQNAQTSQDSTVYWQIVDKEHLPLVMEMEADRMINLVFNEEIVTKEIDVVLNERRSVVDASSTGKVNEAANAAFFWHHPYGKPVIGYEDEIKNYTAQKAKKFYETWYTPSNALLVVAGDVTLDEVTRLAQKYYGALPKKDPPIKNRPTEPSHNDVTTKVILRDDKTKSVFVNWIYQVPSYREFHATKDGIKQALSLRLLDHILTDHSYGALHEVLVHNQKLSYDTGSFYSGVFDDYAKFEIYFFPQIILDVEKIEGIMQGMLYDLSINGPKIEQVERAKERYKLSVEYGKRYLAGFASILADVILAGFTYEDYLLYEKTLETITPEDIKNVVSIYLLKNPSVQIYSYPDRAK